MWISWMFLISSIMNGGAAPPSAAPAVAAYPWTALSQWELDGIALGDTEWEVAAAWGKPSEIEADEWRSDCVTWSYGDGKNVGLCEGTVSFVQVTSRAGKANLNGRELAMAGPDLRRALGKPEFEAEDGWGIVRGPEALKVFVDDRGAPVSLDLFGSEC